MAPPQDVTDLIIDWDCYQTFDRCPLWGHQEYRLGKEGNDTRDVVPLIRRDVLRQAMHKWLELGGWTLSTVSEAQDMMAEVLLRACETVVPQYPGTYSIDFFVSLGPEMGKAVETFQAFLAEYPGATVKGNQEIRIADGDMTLAARVDAMIETRDGAFPIQCTSTRKKARARPAELWWIESLMLREARLHPEPRWPNIGHTGYFLIYATGEMKKVPFKGKRRETFLSQREKVLDTICHELSSATPGSSQCHLCPYHSTCDERYISPSELRCKDEPSGIRTTLLD